MNVIELVLFVGFVFVITLCSRTLGRIFAIPEALVLISIIGLIAVLQRVLAKTPIRESFQLFGLLAAVNFLSIAFAKVFRLPDSIPASFATSFLAVGVVVIGFQIAGLSRKKRKPGQG